PSPTATAAPAPAAELSAPANLSDNPGQSDSADVLFDGEGTLHMVWRG
ncbi:MAG: hypothetical protein HC875_33725, partial [Anaerolineales bacterium]|nr:hypothetical protein [Anaerolineales bacterium]